MIKHFFSLLFLLFLGLGECKVPQLTPLDLKSKIDEILKAHVCHKTLTPELMERSLQNFLEELDPTKTYLIEREIEPWIHPSTATLEEALEGFNNNNFALYQKIHTVFLHAIERHN